MVFVKKVLTAKQMKSVDEYTINSLGIKSVVLMERAALGVCEVIMDRYTEKDRIIIVCGSGNNGADGVAVARILAQYDYDVSVYAAGNSEHFTREMHYQTDIAKKTGVTFVNEPCFNEYNLLVDALFGIGLSRNIEGRYMDIITDMNDSKRDIIAVDIPSGVNGDTGEIMGICVNADITVTFGALKKGIILFPGSFNCGEVILKDAGFPKAAFENAGKCGKIIERGDVGKLIPKRTPDSNKGTYGKLLIIAGSENMSGAACMCAKAAYRSGVGLVTVFTVEKNRIIVQTTVPEAVLKTYNDEHDCTELLDEEIKKADYIVCGPGIGLGDAAKELVKGVLASGKRALLDADALNIVAADDALMKMLHRNIIITPHAGEFGRLVKKGISSIKKDLCGSCISFAEMYNVICVLKDARTVICSPEGDETINIYGNSGMSTAGSGDVLAGIIGGLACQGADDYTAAIAGVTVHGVAGDCAAQIKGQYSLMASDIIDGICVTDIIDGGKNERLG